MAARRPCATLSSGGAGALGLGFGLLFTLMLMGSWLAPRMTFSWERDLVSAINAQNLAGEAVPSPP